MIYRGSSQMSGSRLVDQAPESTLSSSESGGTAGPISYFLNK